MPDVNITNNHLLIAKTQAPNFFDAVHVLPQIRTPKKIKHPDVHFELKKVGPPAQEAIAHLTLDKNPEQPQPQAKIRERSVMRYEKQAKMLPAPSLALSVRDSQSDSLAYQQDWGALHHYVNSPRAHYFHSEGNIEVKPLPTDVLELVTSEPIPELNLLEKCRRAVSHRFGKKSMFLDAANEKTHDIERLVKIELNTDMTSNLLGKHSYATEVLDLVLFFHKAYQLVTCIKSAITHKKEINQLEKEIESLNQRVFKPTQELVHLEDMLNEKKQRLKEVTELFEQDKQGIPLFFTLSGVLLKTVSNTSEVILLLTSKGLLTISGYAVRALSLTSSILFPSALMIALGVGIYNTTKSIQDVRRIAKELKEIDAKLERMLIGKEKIENSAKGFEKESLRAFYNVENRALLAKKQELIEKQRVARLDLATNVLFFSSSSLSFACLFAGPAAPILTAASLALFAAGGGLMIYTYLSSKEQNKKISLINNNFLHLEKSDIVGHAANMTNLIMRAPHLKNEIFVHMGLTLGTVHEIDNDPARLNSFFLEHYSALELDPTKNKT